MPGTTHISRPGWTFNVALFVHGAEAALAIGFIFAVHFFHARLLHAPQAELFQDPSAAEIRRGYVVGIIGLTLGLGQFGLIVNAVV